MWAYGHIYRVYTSDAFMFIVKILGGEMSSRYVDILNPSGQDNRTGAEIAADTIERCGLKVVG